MADYRLLVIFFIILISITDSQGFCPVKETDAQPNFDDDKVSIVYYLCKA